MEFDLGRVTGEQGPAGEGIPAGGTTGQILEKASGDDFDTQWIDPPSGTGGIEDAPADGKLYGRKDEAWTEIPEASGDITVEGISENDLNEAIEAHNTNPDAHETQFEGVHNRIAAIENLGHFSGSFNTFADVPGSIADFPNGITTNDFITVRADETHGGAVTRYVVIQITGGIITWEYDVTYSTDITGKMDSQPTAVQGNIPVFNGSGQVVDSGVSPDDLGGGATGGGITESELTASINSHDTNANAHAIRFTAKQDRITATGATNLLTAPASAGGQPGTKAISTLLEKSGGTMTGALLAQNTAFTTTATTAKVHNIFAGTGAAPANLPNGVIYLRYE